MTIRFACPSCAATGAVAAELIGRSVRCKQCGHRFNIRAPDDQEPESYAVDEPQSDRVDSSPPDPIETPAFVPARGRESSSAPARPKRSPGASNRKRTERRPPVMAFHWRTWLAGVGISAALALLATALLAPRGTLIAGCVLMGLGSLLVLVGYGAGAYGAFREDFLYGSLYLVIPLYTAYYMVTRWEDLWPWLTCSTVGVGLVLLGTELARWGGVTV